MLGRRARLLSASALVLACVALAWAASGPLLGRAAASAASASLGTPVSVGSARLGLFPPRLALERVSLANPPGYDAGPLLAVARLTLSAEPLALLGEPLRIAAASVDGFALHVERAGGRTNLEALRDRVRALAAREPAGARRFVIARLAVRAGRVSAPALFGQRVSVAVKDFELRNVGQQQGGLAPGELLEYLLRLMDPSLRHALRNVDLGAAAKGLLP
jgi:hypothetical protein